MADEIKFDFAKAHSLLQILNDCSHELGELSNALGNEVNEAEQWWSGASYDAFRAKYIGSDSGSGKSSIKVIADRVADVSDRLTKIAEAKKDFERKSSKLF